MSTVAENGRDGMKRCAGPCGATLPAGEFPLIGAHRPGARRHDCAVCRASSLKTMAQKVKELRRTMA